MFPSQRLSPARGNAGSGRANPLAAILSCGLLLRFHWGEATLADRLEAAVQTFLAETDSLDFGIDTTFLIAEGVLQRL